MPFRTSKNPVFINKYTYPEQLVGESVASRLWHPDDAGRCHLEPTGNILSFLP